MRGLGIALAIISIITAAGMSGMFSSSNTAPTPSSPYKGGKTLNRQRNKPHRKKTLRSRK